MVEDNTLKKFTDCYFFVNAKCTNLACEYRHPDLQTLLPVVCRYWSAGDCSNLNCKYLHPSGAVAYQPEPQLTHFPISRPTNKLSETPCVFFVKGTCKNGENCPFVHSANTFKNTTAENNSNNGNNNNDNDNNTESQQSSCESKPAYTFKTKAAQKLSLKRPLPSEISQPVHTNTLPILVHTPKTSLAIDSEKPNKLLTKKTTGTIKSALTPQSSLPQEKEKTPPPKQAQPKTQEDTISNSGKKNFGIKTLDELLRDKKDQGENEAKTKGSDTVSLVHKSDESSSPSKKIKIIPSSRLMPKIELTKPVPTPSVTTTTATTEKANSDQAPRRKLNIIRSPQLKQLTNSNKLKPPTQPPSEKEISPPSTTTTPPLSFSISTDTRIENNTTATTTPVINTTTTTNFNLPNEDNNNDQDTIDEYRDLMEEFGTQNQNENENGDEYAYSGDFAKEVEDLLRNE